MQVGHRFQSSVSDRFGVVCLSETPFSTLMWSHYSHKHTGYALGIKTECFSKLAENGDARFAAVTYSKERSSAILGEWNDSVAFTKSVDWAYEKEWRLCTPLVAGKRLADNPNVVVMSFGIENLIEIIIGCAADEKLGAEIDKIKTAHPQVKLRYSCPSQFRFDMQIREEVPEALIREAYISCSLGQPSPPSSQKRGVVAPNPVFATGGENRKFSAGFRGPNMAQPL